MIPALAWGLLPMAAGMGALHVLEPRHAKTLTAADITGIHAIWRDAVLLTLSRLIWWSRHAPAISAGLILLSGLNAPIPLLHTPAPSHL